MFLTHLKITLKPTFLASKIRTFSTVHQTAQEGFTAKSADSYEKGRPTYTKESLEKINEVIQSSLTIGKSNSPVIVELGAGTGKFTESLAPFLQSNYRQFQYLATEPSEGFRQALLKKNLPNVKSDFGLGDSIPSPDKTVNAVIAAQAFHWMASTKTLKEIHRVLAPGGSLILIWNTYDYSYDWVSYIDKEILTPVYHGVPRQQTGEWRNCFETPEGKEYFPKLESWYSPYHHEGDRQMIINRILSTSVIADKDNKFQLDVEKKLNNLLDTHPELAENRKSGKFSMPYITELVWFHRK